MLHMYTYVAHVNWLYYTLFWFSPQLSIALLHLCNKQSLPWEITVDLKLQTTLFPNVFVITETTFLSCFDTHMTRDHGFKIVFANVYIGLLIKLDI